MAIVITKPMKNLRKKGYRFFANGTVIKKFNKHNAEMHAKNIRDEFKYPARIVKLSEKNAITGDDQYVVMYKIEKK